MSDPSRSKPQPSRGAGSRRSGNPAKRAVADPRPVSTPHGDNFAATSMARTVLASLLIVLGIAWMAVYINVAQDGGQLAWMGGLGRWNFLIGFGAIFVGLALLAHPSTPLGRGRGVVVGMLGSFLVGLIWIVVYYMAGQPTTLPVFRNLDAYNLVVGIGFMAVGFIFATRWE